jgi:hypothetical protein
VNHASNDLMLELLAQSLIAWRIAGSVQRTSGGATLLCANVKEIRIEPAPNNLPFRWMVSVDGRKRGAISLLAVLRQVRAAVDPGCAPNNRVRIAVSPPVPS